MHNRQYSHMQFITRWFRGIFTVLLMLLFFPSLTAQEVDFTSSNLPIVVIDTDGQDIPYDNPRIRAHMGIIWNGPGERNEVTDPYNDYDGVISIEIRGASSSGWSKKSYSIETENIDSSNYNVPLLGMPTENDWVLYAPYYDRSLMRNVLTYRMVETWGWYAPRTRYCELVLNDKYKGVYVLMEKIKRDKNRVDISKMDEDDNAGDSLTGGYIFKVDKEPWKPGFDGKYKPSTEKDLLTRYQYVYPKSDHITPSQEDYISHYVWDFEDAIHSKYPHDPVTGYPAYLNVASFVDNFLINELSKNVDGYRLSSYYHKDRDSKGGKITAGPVWDYNFSFGNIAYYDAEKYTSWSLSYMLSNGFVNGGDPFKVPSWWDPLFHDSLFVEQVISRWHELRQSLLTPDLFGQVVDAIADTLDESKDRNFTIWPGPGDPKLPEDGWFPPMGPTDNFTSYADEIDYLKWWTAQRIEWMDNNIEFLRNNVTPPVTDPLKFRLGQNIPNPFTSSTTIQYELLYQNHVILTIYSLTGRRIAVLVDELQPRGKYNITWSPQGLPAGLYLYELRAGSYRAVRKMSVTR